MVAADIGVKALVTFSGGEVTFCTTNVSLRTSESRNSLHWEMTSFHPGLVEYNIAESLITIRSQLLLFTSSRFDLTKDQIPSRH